jgi:hypothetical protein
MRGLIPALALILGATLAHPSLDAATVEVRVTNGDVITGEVGEETATTIELKRTLLLHHKPTISAIIVPKNTITKRTAVPSFTEQYEARRATTGTTIFEQGALARWCVDRALVDQALVHTKLAEAEDSNSPIVAKLYSDLGFTKVNDAWVNEDEHLANTGLVKVGDKVMTKEEAAAAKEQIIKTNANTRLDQQVKDAEWLIKSGEKKLAEATEKRDTAKSELAKAQADVQGAQSRRDQLEKRIEAAAAASAAGKNQNNRKQQQTNNDQASLQEAANDFSKASSAQQKWKKELASSEDVLARLKVSIEKAKAALPELKKQLEAATGKPAETPATEAKPAGEKPVGEKPTTEVKPKSRFGGQ